MKMHIDKHDKEASIKYDSISNEQISGQYISQGSMYFNNMIIKKSFCQVYSFKRHYIDNRFEIELQRDSNQSLNLTFNKCISCLHANCFSLHVQISVVSTPHIAKYLLFVHSRAVLNSVDFLYLPSRRYLLFIAFKTMCLLELLCEKG